MKIAIPTVNGKLCMHFGHCEVFTLLDLDTEKKTVTSSENVVPPPHEPGLLPKWLGERDVNMIIAGGMGSRAQELFTAQNIQVVVGAPAEDPAVLAKAYMDGSLTTGSNTCDH
jgi:predicted Fe-Mo cluster-binding NifX family protein